MKYIRQIFGKEYKQAKSELEHYWLSSQKDGEEGLGAELRTLRNRMRISTLLGDMTISGAVYQANRLLNKWWYEDE